MGWMLIKLSANERQCPLNTPSLTQAFGTTSPIAMHIRASLQREVWHHGKLGKSPTHRHHCQPLSSASGELQRSSFAYGATPLCFAF